MQTKPALRMHSCVGCFVREMMGGFRPMVRERRLTALIHYSWTIPGPVTRRSRSIPAVL
jgi:hypothetical protein